MSNALKHGHGINFKCTYSKSTLTKSTTCLSLFFIFFFPPEYKVKEIY